MGRKYDVMGNIEAYITKEQADLIIESSRSERDRLLFHLLSRTGRRITEVLMLKAGDIKWETDSIEWNILKKRKATTAILPQNKDTIAMLKEYVNDKEIKPDTFIFKSYGVSGHLTSSRVRYLLKSYGKQLGMERIGGDAIHIHMFRHGFAVRFVRNMTRADQIFQLQKILQHSDIQETMWYLNHFGQSEMREMMEVMWEY